MKLVIVSEKTRYHFQEPLKYFKKIEVIHLFKSCYRDMGPSHYKNLIKYNNIFDLYKKLKTLRPDLIQGLEPYYGYSRFKIPIKVLPILFVTYFYAKLNHIPYFFHVLENIKPKQKYGIIAGWIMQKIAQIYAKGAKFIFYLNNGARENLFLLKVSKNKMTSGLWGIWGLDLNQFKPNDKLKHSKELLFVGRLIEQKGISDIIIALNSLCKIDPAIKLTIVGGEGEYKEKLQQLINQYHLEKNCQFVGQKNDEQLIGYYQRSLLFVSPTRSLKYSAEQIGVANIEAMACGLPVISTKSGSIAEYVIDGKTGLLVSEANPQELANAIRKLVSDDKLSNQMAKNAREYVLKKFDNKKNILELEKIILSRINLNE